MAASTWTSNLPIFLMHPKVKAHPSRFKLPRVKERKNLKEQPQDIYERKNLSKARARKAPTIFIFISIISTGFVMNYLPVKTVKSRTVTRKHHSFKLDIFFEALTQHPKPRKPRRKDPKKVGHWQDCNHQPPGRLKCDRVITTWPWHCHHLSFLSYVGGASLRRAWAQAAQTKFLAFYP